MRSRKGFHRQRPFPNVRFAFTSAATAANKHRKSGGTLLRVWWMRAGRACARRVSGGDGSSSVARSRATPSGVAGRTAVSSVVSEPYKVMLGESGISRPLTESTLLRNSHRLTRAAVSVADASASSIWRCSSWKSSACESSFRRMATVGEEACDADRRRSSGEYRPQAGRTGANVSARLAFAMMLGTGRTTFIRSICHPAWFRDSSSVGGAPLSTWVLLRRSRIPAGQGVLSSPHRPTNQPN